MLNQEANTTEKICGMSYRPPPVRRCASKLLAVENPTVLDTCDYNKSQKLLSMLASPYLQVQSGNGRIELEIGEQPDAKRAAPMYGVEG